MRRIKKAQTPKKMRTGRTQDRMSRRNVLSICPVYLTPYGWSSCAKPGSTRVVENSVWPLGSGSFSFPWMKLSEMPISATLPPWRRPWNSL
jgi:hypothetical protein